MNKLITVLALAAAAAGSPALAKGAHVKVGQTRAHVLAAAGKKFARFDANSDGTTDATEVTASLQARATQAGKTFRPKAAKRALRGADTNSDGKVTLAEYKAVAAARFDRIDTNKNGVIDASEVAPAATTTTPATTG